MADAEKARYQTSELKVIHIIDTLGWGNGKGEDRVAEKGPLGRFWIAPP